MKKIILLIIVFICISATSFAWEITSDGVDGIVLGKPISPSVARNEKEKIDRLIADGVPFKGFKFKLPPLLVSLEHNKVSMIVIDSPDIKTKEKVGVDSTLKQLGSAYKDISINHVPSTFGNDEAVAIIKSLSNVFFYFKDMKTAKSGGRVVRVMIFKQ